MDASVPEERQPSAQGIVPRRSGSDPTQPAGANGASMWGWPLATVFNQTAEYLTDVAQRTVLFWDVMRQRGNQYLAHMEEAAPHVLSFAAELVVDGRKLPRPVNYALAKIVPPDGVEIDDLKRPFVIVDPRAGHGPGIGGFKADSEIGVAMRAGHPCYFIGFLPEPVQGQTIEDIALAEAAFLEKVISLHPKAEGKPAVIGNCQAGWAVMMLAAMRPELLGPIILAGSPLSYWAGVRGANPMRYTGGLLGGSWLTSLAGDLGNGTFDGAMIVENFENLNPSNTLWSKQYNLFAKIDTEAPRYLQFEKWWGGHVLLTGEEMQFIVDNLFIGNKLAPAEIVTRDGIRIDLRAIRSPIIVFCSKGDNITPPQQALGWIPDLYDSVDDIRRHGQTIVYTVHDSVGHLGIFVSSGVARKEHDEFASNIDLIDVLPPGLYEAVLRKKTSDDPNAALAHGDYIARFEARTVDDIRALGGNDGEDDRRFATVARISEINRTLYETFARPWVHLWTNDIVAKGLRQLRPLRLQYELLSDKNPLMGPIAALADQIRRDRRPVSAENPFLELQGKISDGVVRTLDMWRDTRDLLSEQLFLGIYEMPFLRALTGMHPDTLRRKAVVEPLHRAMVEYRIRELRGQMTTGSLREAAIRALVYVGLADASVDERGFSVLRQIRADNREGMSLTEFKTAIREQLFMLLIDEERALAGIREIARRTPQDAGKIMPLLRRVLSATGEPDIERKRRLARVEGIFAEVSGAATVESATVVRPVPSTAASGAREISKPSDRKQKPIEHSDRLKV
jgi:pimeloyl-ACP methyl ester carboxylesterase